MQKKGYILYRMSIAVCPCHRQIFTVLLAALFLGSCSRNNDDITITPPVTLPLSRQLIGYGVINVSYTHVTDQPDPAEPSLGYLRRGSIIKVIERRPVSIRTVGSRQTAGQTDVESWVLVEGSFRGWLPETVVDIYDSEGQAQTAAGSMTQ
jgi:hypothetical protein